MEAGDAKCTGVASGMTSDYMATTLAGVIDVFESSAAANAGMQCAGTGTTTATESPPPPPPPPSPSLPLVSAALPARGGAQAASVATAARATIAAAGGVEHAAAGRTRRGRRHLRLAGRDLRLVVEFLSY